MKFSFYTSWYLNLNIYFYAKLISVYICSCLDKILQSFCILQICYTSASPWILLHKLLLWQETEAGPEDKAEAPGVVDLEPELPGSLSLLISAHTYLGQKSCCTMDHGRLLGYIVDIFVPIVTFDPSDRVYRCVHVFDNMVHNT